MSGSEIYLKLKGWFEDKISTPVKNALANIGKWAKNAGGALNSLNHVLDSVGGTARKVLSSVGQIFAVFKCALARAHTRAHTRVYINYFN